jgi:hypothetical protein
LAYPRGKRGWRAEVIERRAATLLRDLVADKSGAASRIARIKQELEIVWTRGHANGCQWRSRQPQNDDARPR